MLWQAPESASALQ
jgi:hypothetical protein